ncbi:MAG: homoserine kinase [Rhodospirillales bacterium]|nr:homoserine kinase [Rhodospirillales bacterium]
MAVYTEVGDEELIAFVGEYDIGEVLSSKGIAEGIENSNFTLTTTSGTYILTLYEKRVKPEDLPFFLGLMEHLATAGIPCPTPIHGRDGKALRRLAGRPAAIVTFLAGMWPRRITPEHCSQLGQGLAKLHLAGAGFGIGLPTGVIHGDLFPDNVFFRARKLTGMIDFYFACNDMFAYDLAICLNAWCFESDHSFNITKARRMLTAYRKVRDFSTAELAALPLLARGSAMRFLLTRLYDWLHTPAEAMVTCKDPLEYLAKLRFHQGVKSPGAYGLD